MEIWSQEWLRSCLKYLWIISIVFLVWQAYSSYPQLPDRMASHFDASGNPDRWSSKSGFFTMWYVLIFGMNGIWLLSVVLISKLSGKNLRWTFNIPNRDYWFETEERKGKCVRLMNTMMFGIAFLTNIMWGFILHGIIQSNIETKIHIRMWVIFVPVGIMLVFTFVYLLTAFRKPTKP